MNWNGAHLHLVLNHVPILGSLFGLLLLLTARRMKNSQMLQTCFATFVIVAVFTIAVYLTGEPAEGTIKGLPGVAESLIEEHQDAALAASVAIWLLGALSAYGLWRTRHSSAMPLWLPNACLLLALLGSGLMFWTGALGGQIRHTEIRLSAPAPSAEKP